MSIYGGGTNARSTYCRAAAAQREQLLARHWECVCPYCGKDVAPIPTAETKSLYPTSVYAVTKRDHEELCHVVGSAYGIPTVALRFFNVYGSGQALSNPYTGVAAIFSSRLLNGNPPLIFEDGLQSRDFVHVSDIVEAILKALESEAAVGASLNVGTGNAVTIEQVARLLESRLGTSIAPERQETYRAGDIRHCVADPTRARELPALRLLCLRGWRCRTRRVGKEDGERPRRRHCELAHAASHAGRRLVHDLAIIVISTNGAHFGCRPA
jgi:dTDP-L-rhamnose 4-epimerase